MTNTFTFAIDPSPSPDDVRAVHAGLNDYNLLHAPPHGYQPLTILVRDAAGALAGGLLGASAWGWLHVDIFWLREDARGEGLGSRILAEAEAEARRRGCHHLFLDTMSFQALPFYQKLGYEKWGQLNDFPIGHTRHFLKKRLDGA